MTIVGGQAGRWADSASGVRNSRAASTDQAGVLPHLNEKIELTGRHAEGATCEVFKAHHVALDIAVAVKVLRPEYVTDARFLERMRIEAQVLPRLRSPHIVQCFDRGLTADGRPYTVLEFLRGETLEALLERFGKFDELVTVELGVALFEALAVAHSRGIVHRDVSLRNLIVHRTEHELPTLKLIDFGFALVMPSAPESAPEPAEAPDRDSAVGTPRFTSPEVATGRRDIDGRADLYSAGVILYTLLAGRDPFAELRSPDAVLEAHAHRAVPPLSLHARGVSKELENVVMRLVEKQRANRFSSAKQAAQGLMEAGEVLRRRAHSVHTVPPATSSRPALNVGDRCGPYIITRLIDGGGAAEVYEAEADGALKRRVALKLAKRPLTARDRARFLEGARQLMSIRHPNLPSVHQAGDLAGRPWIAMGFVQGEPLRALFERKHALDRPTAMKLAYGIARALYQLERLALIQGRVTPSSVVVTSTGEACVIHALPGLASAGHAAPDGRSDVQQWGALVSELFAAPAERSRDASPRAGASGLGALLQPLESVSSSIGGELPRPLRMLLEAATDPQPLRHPSSFVEVCAALDEACGTLPLAFPLAATPDYSVAVTGAFLVLVWRAPHAAAVREARAQVRNAKFRAALIVVEASALHPDESAQAVLRDLMHDIESRATVAAILHEGSAFGGAHLRSKLASSGYVPQCESVASVFTSRQTAVDWLERYHSTLEGTSYLSGAIATLGRAPTRAPSPSVRVDDPTPLSEPPLGGDLRVPLAAEDGHAAFVGVTNIEASFPIPDADLRAQYSMRAEAPVPSIRGGYIAPSRAWIISNYGEESYRAGVAKLPEADRAAFAAELVSVVWYPLEQWTTILKEVRAQAWHTKREDEGTFDRRHMYDSISGTMTGIYRIAFGLFSPQTIIGKVTPYFKRVYSHGEYEVIENEPRHCVLRFRDAPVLMLPELERSFPLAASWMLDVAGQQVTRHQLAPNVRGSTFSCDLTLDYRPKSEVKNERKSAHA